MSFIIKTTTTNIDDVANFIAFSVLNQLQLGKKVLFFVTGGSSVAVGAKVAELLKGRGCENLTVTLTDERHGLVGHADSNWQQLISKGFSIPKAKLIPVLSGKDLDSTVQNFNEVLKQELKNSEYKIGLFGVGKDGHTAGILPGSVAVNSDNLAVGYDTPTFSRVTITPKVIEQLDEAVVFMQGKEKWGVVDDLLNKDIDIMKQPSQILKKVPLVTLFSDYKK